MCWGGGFNSNTNWTYQEHASGTLYYFPAEMPSTTTWSSLSSPGTNWARNEGYGNRIVLWFLADNTQGACHQFKIYGYGNTSNNGSVIFLYYSPNNTSGWMVSQSIEILTSSSTIGGTWSWIDGTIYSDNGYNNINP